MIDNEISKVVRTKTSAEKVIELITTQLNNQEINQEEFDSIYTMVYPTPESIELRNQKLRNAKLGL
jgi:hypothetical protein